MNPHTEKHWCSCHFVLDTFLFLLSFLQCQLIVHILGSSLASDFLIIKCNFTKFVIVYHKILGLSIYICFSSYTLPACLPVCPSIHPPACLPTYQNSTVCTFNISDNLTTALQLHSATSPPLLIVPKWLFGTEQVAIGINGNIIPLSNSNLRIWWLACIGLWVRHGEINDTTVLYRPDPNLFLQLLFKVQNLKTNKKIFYFCKDK